MNMTPDESYDLARDIAEAKAKSTRKVCVKLQGGPLDGGLFKTANIPPVALIESAGRVYRYIYMGGLRPDSYEFDGEVS